MDKLPSCQNCDSPRRPVKARGLCSVCLSWQKRIDKYYKKLEQAKNNPQRYYQDARTLPLQIEMAKRVLKEFRWRENGLRTDSTDEWHVEALVNILAQVSRSNFPCNTNHLIQRVPPQSRRLIYEILLAIVENIPALYPPINEGWARWRSDYYLAPSSKEKLELEKAHLDSLRESSIPK